MANFNRSIKSDLWMTIDFRNLTSDEKVVYLFLHTADISSDSSVFFCPLSDISSSCNISKKKIMNIFKKFEEEHYIVYDYKRQEVCVLDYFWLHPPIGGIYYEMFSKDISKVKSTIVIDALVEAAKNYEISMAFFTALQDVRPEISEYDYIIKPSEKSPEELRTAAKRGRKKIRENTIPRLEPESHKALSTNDEDDDDMPF